MPDEGGGCGFYVAKDEVDCGADDGRATGGSQGLKRGEQSVERAVPGMIACASGPL
jgi:hypothetical protein